MSAVRVLLLISLISTSIAAEFKCSSTSTCNAIIDYISPNTTTLAHIATQFGVSQLSSIIGVNSLPATTTGKYSIVANHTIRIPFPCVCSNGTGISDHKPVYTVVLNDGLNHIAVDVFGGLVTYQEIAAANNIPDPNKIFVGQNITIPLPCSCDDVGGEKVVHYGYIVPAGSSVEQIAETYGTTESTLLSINGIANASQLLAGQVLDVPLKEGSRRILELFSLGEAISNLQNEFESLQGFLKDAEKRREEDKNVSKWMSSIKDLAYEAQEITEKHNKSIRRHRRRTQGSGGCNFSGNPLRAFLRSMDTMVLARDASRIYSLTKKISRLTCNMKAYGIEFTPLVDPPSGTIPHNVSSFELAAEEAESLVVGLEDDVKEIENQLICTESPKVIGICGANGLGKTTLVREVLRTSTLVKEHFDSIFWAELGSEFQAGEVLKKMLLHLQSNAGHDVTTAGLEEEDINTMCDLVSKILIEKRCLLVLDDLQTGLDDTFRSTLSSIFHPLAHSRVIVTTCNAGVLASVDPQAYLHQPRCMTSEEIWLLFQRRTASLGQGIRGKVVKRIGKSCLKGEFVGLPFSILVLAGILANDIGPILSVIYHGVLRKPILRGLLVRSKLPSGKSALFGGDEIGIQQVLKLSYKVLPIHLRLCLVLMSNHCPGDGNKISTEELYKVWIDDHRIVKRRRLPAAAQEIAEGYLDELVKRSLVQVVEKDRATGQTLSCKLNSLVRDFYRLKATTAGSLLERIQYLFFL